ncbi:MAG: ABC transporter substrate-binding protein [Planctomycetota bacterium]
MLRSLLVFLLGLSLLGCAGDEPVGESDAPPKVGVSIPTATHGWPAGVGYWAQETIDAYPDIEWTYQKADSAEKQSAQIDAMVEAGVQTLVVLPMNSDTLLPALRRAKDRGVYIVSVDRGLSDPIADLYVAGDNARFGQVAAEFMAEQLNGTGKIVVLRGMTVEIDNERFSAFEEEIGKHAGIEILDVQHGEWNREKSYNVFAAMLQQHPEIDAVWASDDDMALGVEKALNEAGRTEEMWILGGAGMKDIVKRVRDGDRLFPANVTYPPGMIAAGIHLGAAHATGQPETAVADAIPDHLNLDTTQLSDEPTSTGGDQRDVRIGIQLVTPENAEQFYFPDSVY